MRHILIALGVVGILILSGCASDKGINETGYGPGPKTDLKGHSLKSADARHLYESARDYLMHGKPSEALPLYARVDARFPFSKYAPQAALEMIAAHYQAGDYQKAVHTADQFIKQHPRYTHVDYAYYMRGMADFARNNPSLIGAQPDKRSIKYLKQAFNDFKLLIKNYPNSDYAKDAQLHMIAARNRIAKFELHIAEYYYKRRAYIAASRRAEDIMKKYQGADSMPRALEIMEQSYAKLKLPGLAEDTRAILQTSYPNYLLHRREFYRQQAGDKPDYVLPDMGAPPARGESSQG